ACLRTTPSAAAVRVAAAVLISPTCAWSGAARTTTPPAPRRRKSPPAPRSVPFRRLSLIRHLHSPKKRHETRIIRQSSPVRTLAHRPGFRRKESRRRDLSQRLALQRRHQRHVADGYATGVARRHRARHHIGRLFQFVLPISG